MKTKILYNTFLTLYVAIALSSCSDEYVKGTFIASNNEYSLNMSNHDLQSIPAAGGIINAKIEATSAVDWEIQGLPSWLTTTTTNGTGSQDISFNVDANESFTSSRTHIFNLITNNSDWKLTIPVSVTQLKKTKEMTITPSDDVSLTFDSKGGQKTLTITSNVAWNAECNEEFVHLSQSSAAQDLNMVVSVDAYDLIDVTQKRTASIYFKDAAEHDVLKVLTITQTPLHTSISTENISVEFDQNRNSKVFSLGNMLGRYSVSSDAPWLNIEKNKEYGNVDVTVSVETNENDDERTSKAYVFLDDTNVILYSFSVRQKGSCIEIQPTNLSCVADGGVYSIDVSTNDRWTASTQQEWITLHENGKSCSIAVSENNSLQTRSGVVQFYRLNANNEIVGKTVSLSILQEARHISPDIQTIQFGPEAAQKTLSINSDATWKLSSNESWISLSSDAGNGNADVCVSVTENTSSSSRTGSLYLKCLDKTIEILVVQNTAYLNTNTNSIRFDAKGGEANVGISTNVNWTANTNENWLSISPKNGNGDADIILKADKNYTSSQKKGIISINSLLGEYCINVSQSAPALEVSKSNVSFDYNGGSEVIIISTDYEYNVKNSSSWIVVEQNNNSLTITAKENKTWQSRSASVVIQLVGIEGVVTRTINILQKFDETSFVDLGLPSGTKWCKRNYGASNSDEFGKECTWSNNNNMGILPTRDQVNELITKCTWQWEYIKFDQYSTKVVPTVICVVTGPNGRSIRIPMVPWIGYQSQCWYWIGESINDDILGKCGYCFTTGRYTNDIFIISKEIQYSQNSYIRFVTK